MELLRLACVAAALCVAMMTAGPARADAGAGIALLSDYRFRGVSLSDNGPAAQAHVDLSHESGIFAGALVATVRPGYAGAESGISLQGYAGYSGTVAGDVSWSTGIAGYTFPSSKEGSTDYAEWFGRMSRNDLRAGVFLSQSYFGSGASSVYLELSGSHEINDVVSLALHLGWLATASAGAGYSRYAGIQRLDGRFGMIVDLRYATAELSIVGASSHGDDCRPHSLCSPAAVVILRKEF
jgi:uncharacterized protein (TIGR02001 family)